MVSKDSPSLEICGDYVCRNDVLGVIPIPESAGTEGMGNDAFGAIRK